MTYLEEAASRFACGWGENDDEKSFISGAKWQAEKMYSEEEVIKILNSFSWRTGIDHEEKRTNIWFEQFKKK